MADVDQERLLLLQRGGERGEQVRRDVIDHTADTTYEVYVLFSGDAVIRRCAVGQVCVGHQTEFLKQLESAVNGGDVDPGRSLGHLRVNLIRRRMPQRVDRLEHQLALGGEPQTTRAELVGELRLPAGLADLAGRR